MKHLKISIMVFFIMSLLCGIFYPLSITGIARLIVPRMADGDIIRLKNRIIGSTLIGQKFTGPRYFHGRPSASQYNGVSSGGSNFGPTNMNYIDTVAQAILLTRKENNMPHDAKVPPDLALASGSGLDPHIRIESALLQIPRIARERRVEPHSIITIIKKYSEKQYFGLWGNSHVNVLLCNVALDELNDIK